MNLQPDRRHCPTHPWYQNVHHLGEIFVWQETFSLAPPKIKDKSISRRAKNRGTTFIQWTCHSFVLMQLLDWVAWFSILDGSQHRHFSGLRWRENQFSTLVLYRFLGWESRNFFPIKNLKVVFQQEICLLRFCILTNEATLTFLD